MITGYNTDIEYNGVIYHVQTEDKGLETPMILSLVYNRGTILASKRSPYNDLVEKGFDEKVLAERLQKQHKIICAAVRAGRIEDLKKLSIREATLRKNLNAADRSKILQSANLTNDPANVADSATKKSESDSSGSASGSFTAPIPQPQEELIWDLPLQILEDEMIFEADSIIEEGLLIEDAVEIIPDLTAGVANTKDELEIKFLSETDFKAGERRTLQICVFRSQPENIVVGAQVMVKVLGSSFRPLIFHAKTDRYGVAVVHLQFPQFRNGRAAVLVRAISNGEEAELRQIIRPA